MLKLIFLFPALLYSQTILIDCGSSTDQYYTLGTSWRSPTPINPLYDTVRYGNFYYTIPLPVPGKYNITLKFIENVVGPNQRKFNVNINGVDVLTNFDIASEIGLGRILDKSYQINVTNEARIQLTTVLRNAVISAIQIDKIIAKRVIGELLPAPYNLPPGATNIEVYVNGLHYWEIEDYDIINGTIVPKVGNSNWPAPEDSRVRINYDLN